MKIKWQFWRKWYVVKLFLKNVFNLLRKKSCVLFGVNTIINDETFIYFQSTALKQYKIFSLKIIYLLVRKNNNKFHFATFEKFFIYYLFFVTSIRPTLLNGLNNILSFLKSFFIHFYLLLDISILHGENVK